MSETQISLLQDLLKSRLVDTLPNYKTYAPNVATKRQRREFIKALKRQLTILIDDYDVYTKFENGGKKHMVEPEYKKGVVRWWKTNNLELCLRKGASVFMAEHTKWSGFGYQYLGVSHSTHEELAETFLKLIGYTELGYFDEFIFLGCNISDDHEH